MDQFQCISCPILYLCTDRKTISNWTELKKKSLWKGEVTKAKLQTAFIDQIDTLTLEQKGLIISFRIRATDRIIAGHIFRAFAMVRYPDAAIFRRTRYYPNVGGAVHIHFYDVQSWT